MKTNLFIAGACKCGTSFLHDFLGNQDDIFSSTPKEPYFFELPFENRNEKEYLNKYFYGTTGNEKYWLDSRHRNMFFSWIPKEMKAFNSDAKIIFILRNPIERAFSHWWMWYSRGILKTNFYKTISNEIKKHEKGDFEMNKSPEEYLDYIKKNVKDGRIAFADANTIVETGFYYTQLKRFYDIFSSSQILVIDYDELKNMDLLSKKLTKFLDVEVKNEQQQKVVNQAKKHKKTSFKFSFLIPNIIKRIIKNKFYSKPKMNLKSKNVLLNNYRVENQKLISEFGFEFVEKWNK